jgi:opine dehydrogenase
MRVSVLGSGNGGIALAADWSLNGHTVRLFDFEQFSSNISAVNKNGGIYCEGDLQGFAKIEYSGHDLEKALENADVIFVVGPAYSTEPFALECKKHLKKGQVYIICPSSCCGAVVFKNALGVALESEDVIVGDTSTLPYACRVTEFGKVKVYLKLKGGLYIAALPAKMNKVVYDIFSKVYTCEEIPLSIQPLHFLMPVESKAPMAISFFMKTV